ncbi:Ribokinase [Zancudomyces culisetae]|uniref:Ribokinase n=1 Tax=Zancudomyces culisetae TaxID=1213189 RepID=A0A1R1PZH9_ZANCU|nr:Ribokinase [Zancudomyces culisetae]|eukprot:OMH86371.1 Ribokinase [Zancudomyces culisetae]
MSRILVYGSINIDEVYTVPHIVRPGETIGTTERLEVAGGKGANSCVAMSMAGGESYLLAKIGEDGKWVKDIIESKGTNIEMISESKSEQTGRAIIQVSEKDGENSILLFKGGNHRHEYQETIEKIDRAGFGKNDYLVLANETNLILEIVKYCKTERNMTVVYNPAPMPQFDSVYDYCETGKKEKEGVNESSKCNRGTPRLWRDIMKQVLEYVDVLVVNETEMEALYQEVCDQKGNEQEVDYVEMLKLLKEKIGSIKTIVMTLGSKGVVCGHGDHEILRCGIAPIDQSKVIDTTAAGDTWIGYFVVELANQSKDSVSADGSAGITVEMLNSAMKVASHASGLSVCSKGAIPSIPPRSEVIRFLNNECI